MFLLLLSFVTLAAAADITWVDCASNVPSPLADTTLPDTLPATLACGRLDVPLDYSKDLADDNVITLGFSMYRPENPQGLLNFNPGGPGQEVSSYPWRLALNITPAASWFEGLEGFDILAIDTRGCYSSNALNCTVGDWIVPSKLPETEEEYESFKTQVGTYAQSCIDQSSPPGIVQHLSTADVIHDWDLVRQALGYTTIHHFGISYGTYYGANYAATYPEHTGRFALDAVFATGISNHDLLATQYKSMQGLLYRADAACLNDTSCPFHAQGKGGVPKAFEEVLALASNGTGPIPVSDIRQRVAMWYFLGAPQLTDFNAALGRALSGNWTEWDYSLMGETFTSYFVPLARTFCLDYHIEDNSYEGWSNLRESLKEADTANVNYVFFQALHALCTGWPYGASSNEKLSINASMVLVTADWDSNTPTDSATFEWQQAPNSALIDRHGDGHGTYDVPGPARDAFINFLVTGDLPAALDDPEVGIYPPVSTRGDSPDPYSVPTGPAYGDTA
ncbi:alpha/beta-hydrolase [Cylindrobasidium torrendii FP15055 ss-10]|uniref:Alpha/beta-hydrolase n=1 Tax=Cylindrobasidium torrendii FP15055 ss-10 TaxID=1314674 RepID=A0A0D7B5J7_9AGAR|nr:alpha/beta-hydrolase [Cylindrobasidium torrendii FP15055 ss-10]